MNENINHNRRSEKKSRNLYINKRGLPNSLKSNPMFNFRAMSLSPSVILHLRDLGKHKQQNTFINNAINSHYFYCNNFKGFVRNIIELNFGMVRHILRQVGRKRSEDNV